MKLTQKKQNKQNKKTSKKQDNITGGKIKTFFKKKIKYVSDYISSVYNAVYNVAYVDDVIRYNKLNQKYNIITSYWDDWLFDREEYNYYLEDNNINDTTFYKLMIGKMEEYSHIFEDTLKNKEYLTLLKNMQIVPYCYEEENGEKNKPAEAISEDNFVNGKVFIFGIDGQYLYNDNNYALLYIINLIYIKQKKATQKYITKFEKQNIQDKLSKKQNNNYFATCIKKLKENNSYENQIEKNIEQYKTTTTAVLEYIKKHNVNNSEFYKNIINTMEKQTNIFDDYTLKNKTYFNIIKNMYIVENIDEPLKDAFGEEIDVFLEKLQKTGTLFIFGKTSHTKMNPALLDIINEIHNNTKPNTNT
jgi:hypothetical protein